MRAPLRPAALHWLASTTIALLLCAERPLHAQSAPAADEPPDSAAAAATAPWYRQVTFNGLASVSFLSNFNRPTSGTNQFRVFDADDATFKVDVVEFVLQKAVVQPGQSGFRADLTFGSSVSKAVASPGLFRDASGKASDIDLHQAFLTTLVGAGNGLRLDLGKFVTHFGYEVIDGFDGYNDNQSRSLLFGYAQPATQCGVRASYPLSKAAAVQLHVVNGWDVARDNNRGKSVGAQLALTPCPRLTGYLNYMGGPEQSQSAHRRDAVDLVAVGKISERITLAINYDFGTEQGVALADTTSGGTADARWQGVAGYVRTSVWDRFAVIVRGEWFEDLDGARTGAAQTLHEFTLTPEWKVTPQFLIRADLRRDGSTRGAFDHHDGKLVNSQVTLGLNALVVW